MTFFPSKMTIKAQKWKFGNFTELSLTIRHLYKPQRSDPMRFWNRFTILSSSINIFVWDRWIFKFLLLNINFGFFLRFDLFQKWWRHHESYQILVPKLTTFPNFSPCVSKKLIFGENEGLLNPSSLYKNGNGNRPLPEATVVWSDRKWKNVWTGSQKLYFWRACKKLFRGSYSSFLISCH